MKTLSVRQPWAWLIVNGYKNIENRSWSTDYRGPLLIHASKTVEDVQVTDITLPTEYDRGGIVGLVTLVDVVTSSASRWFTGKYGFVLQDAKSLPFTPMRGKQGLFEVTHA